MASRTRAAGEQTSTETRRVFLRAERGDQLRITDIVRNIANIDIPEELDIIQRQMTYYGPKLRLEGKDEQYLLTSPGPDSQAMLWCLRDFEWIHAAEVRVDFAAELPQYDICPDCGKPISTMAHERRSFLGTCNK